MAELRLVTDPLPLDFGRDKPYCVYVYFDPRPKKKRQPIYVGKGMTESRPAQHWRRGSHNFLLREVLDDVAEAGLQPIIEYAGFFDKESDALRYEQGLIAKYGRRNIGTGSLCNLSAGDPRPSHPAKSRKGVNFLEVRVLVPAPMLLSIDALIGKRYMDRAEAIRALLHDALRAQP
jgi:hypothetical protein